MSMARIHVSDENLVDALVVLNAQMIDCDLDSGDRIMVREGEVDIALGALSQENIDADLI